jgi:acyl dehydratase
MGVRILQTLGEIQALVGQEAGVSEWITVGQDRIVQFADATGDHQWIHLDVERAKRESPYNSTIAHGFLSLSLLPAMGRQVVGYGDAVKMTINYGLNRVRFPAAVRAGARVRGRFRLLSTEQFEGGLQLVWAVVVEAEGSAKPCVAAEWVTRIYVERAESTVPQDQTRNA